MRNPESTKKRSTAAHPQGIRRTFEWKTTITTAAIPGKRAPILVTAEAVAAMAPGSVIVDLAAETGGNVDGTASPTGSKIE